MKSNWALLSVFGLGFSGCAMDVSELGDSKTPVSESAMAEAVGSDEATNGTWSHPQSSNLDKPALNVRWSEKTFDSFRLRDDKSGAYLDVRPHLQNTANVEIANGKMIQRGAGPDGGDVSYRLHTDRIEDFVNINDEKTAPNLDYDVTLGETIVALRRIENVIEFLDAAGAPRFRILPPYLIDAENNTLPVHLAIEGCAFDQDARAPWNRPIVRAGARNCLIRASWDPQSAVYPIVVDPAWSVTTNMAVARAYHTATSLPSGQVLVVGGNPTATFGELYDPKTDTWAITGSTSVAHRKHTATTLNDAGDVMIIGGDTAASGQSVEIWSPQSGSFTPGAPLTVGRFDHVAVPFSDGSGEHVFVAGGFLANDGFSTPQAVEIWSSASQTFTLSGQLAVTAGDVAASLLKKGNGILLSGGRSARIVHFKGAFLKLQFPLKTAEIFDLSTNKSKIVANTIYTHCGHEHVTLTDGRIMSVGGAVNAEIFSPATESWTLTGGMYNARTNHSTTLLPSGKALVAGGTISGPISGTSPLAMMYTPGTNSFQYTSTMASARTGHTATRLDSGGVLIAGGEAASGPLASVEIFTE